MFTKMLLAATVLDGFAVTSAVLAAQKPYQVTKQVDCSGFGCTLNFDPLPAPVLLKHVACQFFDIGSSQPLQCTISGDYIDTKASAV